MPTRKIADLVEPCTSPEHNPPTMRLYENGVYEHICPRCGAKQIFGVRHPSFRMGSLLNV